MNRSHRIQVLSVGRAVALACLSIAVVTACSRLAADELPYELPKELKVVLVDTSEDESFLAVGCDSLGRLWVGGREALFLYEPTADGGYSPRQERLRLPKDSWIYDIAIRGDDLYLLTVSALYRLPHGVSRGNAAKDLERLVWGVPMGHVHQCFHGMTIGPEGDIYFAMGDPVWYYGDFSRPDHWGHWTFFSRHGGSTSGIAPGDSSKPQDYVATPYTGVGGVFRCKPDGSDFRVVSRGLRNCCGLAFDRDWNLFSNDNDHESMPASYVPGRLVHVTPKSYFSWPRGWAVEKTPERADLLETMYDKLGRYVPVGQAYYDDAYLGEAYRDNLLVARWCTRAITRYPLTPRGASFRATSEEHVLDGSGIARPVHVSVGRGGRLFASVAYMAQNESSPIYRGDLVMIARADDETPYAFEAYDEQKATLDRLWSELASGDWSRRYRAHVELTRRAQDGKAEDRETIAEQAARLLAANAKGETPAASSLVWLAALGETPAAGQAVNWSLAKSMADAGTRLQVVRALAEYPRLGATKDDFVAALADADPHVQLAAIVGLFGRGDVPPPVIDGPARSTDTYLRQTATILLAEQGTLSQLADICDARDAATRLAGVLAVGFRLTLPPATGPLPEGTPLEKLREEVSYTIEYAHATVGGEGVKTDLRQVAPIGNFTIAEMWQKAQHPHEWSELFDLLTARLKDEDEGVRLQAAHFLSLVNDARSEPLIAETIAANEERRLQTAPTTSVSELWFAGPFADLGQGFRKVHPPEAGAVDLAATYDDSGHAIEWRTRPRGERWFRFPEIVGQADDSSVYAYCRLESSASQPIQLLIGSDDGFEVWVNGRLAHALDTVRAALPNQDAVSARLQPGGNDLLIRVHNHVGESGLYLSFRTLTKVEVRLPQKLPTAGLADRLAAASAVGGSAIAPEFLSADWPAAVAKGNAAVGRQLFETIGCVKCHALAADANSQGGPSLADAGKRFTLSHLVESVLAPSKEVSPIFKATSIQTLDGRVLTGLVIGETADKVELLQPDATRVVIATADIDVRATQELSPMPQGLVKTPQELADILAFLLETKN